MKFKIEIKCDNAAFYPYAENEVARILDRICARLEEDSASALEEKGLYLMDYNGNHVGYAKFEEDADT